MKGRSILLDHLGGRPAAAMLLDGRLDDLLVAPPEGVPVPGAIFRSAAGRQMKGQGGIVVDLGDRTGWLREARGIAPGASLLVQVTGFAEPGKAVPVTLRPLFKSRFVIATPGAPGYNVSRAVRDEAAREALLLLAHDVAGAPEGRGLILRSACEGADADAVAQDIVETMDLAARIMADGGRTPGLLLDGPDPHRTAWRDWPAPDTFDDAPGCFGNHGAAEMIDALARARVELPGGAWMSVEPTRALVAVDVNTGGDTSLSAGLKANIAAARALPAQLRCRGLGGQITLDLAPMPKKERRVLEQVFGAALRADPVATTLAGWTPLGCFELQRKRDRLPLSALLDPAATP